MRPQVALPLGVTTFHDKSGAEVKMRFSAMPTPIPAKMAHAILLRYERLAGLVFTRLIVLLSTYPVMSKLHVMPVWQEVVSFFGSETPKIVFVTLYLTITFLPVIIRRPRVQTSTASYRGSSDKGADMSLV